MIKIKKNDLYFKIQLTDIHLELFVNSFAKKRVLKKQKSKHFEVVKKAKNQICFSLLSAYYQ